MKNDEIVLYRLFVELRLIMSPLFSWKTIVFNHAVSDKEETNPSA